MNMEEEKIVTGLVALNGGELIGRTRLQKQAYLLDRCGADFDLRFTYHHYGPYCFDLVDGLTDAVAKGLITVEERPGRHGVPYAIFRSDARPPQDFGSLSADRVRDILARVGDTTDMVLELAATLIFLRNEWDYYGKGEINEIEETRARKPLKATDERIEEAVTLLRDIGLWEHVASTAA